MAVIGETLESWRSTLRKVLMLRPEHISAYSLIIEEGTPFFKAYHDHPELLPDEDTEREMYYETKSMLHKQGFERYEISNYAKPGYECRHNIGYWTGIEYLGLGLGASSYIQGFRFHNESEPTPMRNCTRRSRNCQTRKKWKNLCFWDCA